MDHSLVYDYDRFEKQLMESYGADKGRLLALREEVCFLREVVTKMGGNPVRELEHKMFVNYLDKHF